MRLRASVWGVGRLSESGIALRSLSPLFLSLHLSWTGPHSPLTDSVFPSNCNLYRRVMLEEERIKHAQPNWLWRSDSRLGPSLLPPPGAEAPLSPGGAPPLACPRRGGCRAPLPEVGAGRGTQGREADSSPGPWAFQRHSSPGNSPSLPLRFSETGARRREDAGHGGEASGRPERTEPGPSTLAAVPGLSCRGHCPELRWRDWRRSSSLFLPTLLSRRKRGASTRARNELVFDHSYFTPK